VMRERIEAMRAIWTQEEAEYHGDFVDFGPMITRPKPIQTPHPPVLVGGGLPYGARRALTYGDGWVPHAHRPTYRLLDKLPEYREMEKAAGRTLPITAFGPEHDPAAWPAYRDAGIERIVISIASEPSDTVLPLLDKLAAGLAAIAS
jgi:alkanesulfonate monooxygenase SsuD/methylene tetrahydromethanopterin reductase-like flavin-dependent oxidoreductase (luciferase family)